MSRVNLKEFRPIDFATFVPEQDPNNALFPRVSMVAKMLHEIPWFKKSDDEGEKEVTGEEYSTFSDIAENPKKREAFIGGLDTELFEGMNPQLIPKKNITTEIGGMPVSVRNPFALSDDEAELNNKRSELDEWRNAFNEWSGVSFKDISKDKDMTKSFQEFVNQNGKKIDVDGIAGKQTYGAYKDLFNKKNKDKYESEAKKRIYGDIEDSGEDVFAENPNTNYLDFLSTVFDDEE